MDTQLQNAHQLVAVSLWTIATIFILFSILSTGGCSKKLEQISRKLDYLVMNMQNYAPTTAQTSNSSAMEFDLGQFPIESVENLNKFNELLKIKDARVKYVSTFFAKCDTYFAKAGLKS